MEEVDENCVDVKIASVFKLFAKGNKDADGDDKISLPRYPKVIKVVLEMSGLVEDNWIKSDEMRT